MVMEGGRCEGEEGDEEDQTQGRRKIFYFQFLFSQPKTPVYIK
jgi:hypothetical protein